MAQPKVKSAGATRIFKAGDDIAAVIDAVNRSVADETGMRARLAVFKEGHNLTGKLALGRASGWFHPLLADLMAQGVSVVVNDIGLTDAACAAVARVTGVPAERIFQQNLYITPREVQGFVPHCDPHEVVVAQLYGRKEWMLYDKMLDNPLIFDGGKDVLVADPGEKLAIAERLTVVPGDVFVIPRGRFHAACAQDGASVHLAVGCAGIRPVDVIWAYASAAMERSELRADMDAAAAAKAARAFLAGGRVTLDLPRGRRAPAAVPDGPAALSFQAVLDDL